MSDFQPQTTRQFIEFAMRRLVDTRASLPGSTWQHIMRFFLGDKLTNQVAYECEPPKTEVMAEDGTPLMVSVDLRIAISCNMHDASAVTDYTQACANMIGLVYDGTALPQALNSAMEPDYGDFFRVVRNVPQGDAKTSVEGHRQITEIKTTLWLPPPELALSWAAQNPN